MAHNFLEGINWIADAAGNTALANHRFVSASGSNANAGTSPNSPWATVLYAFTTGANLTAVVGAGLISTTCFTANGNANFIKTDGHNVYAIGDGTAICVTGGTFGSCGIYKVIFKNWSRHISSFYNSVGPSGGMQIEECIFIGNQSDIGHQNQLNYSHNFKNNKHINHTCALYGHAWGNGLSGSAPIYTYGDSFFGGVLDCSATNFAFHSGATVGFSDFYFHPDSRIKIRESQLTGTKNFTNCNIRCPIEIIGTNAAVYANLAAAKIAYPNAFVGCVNVDPVFLGDPFKLEFTISPVSPMIGTGVYVYNIGNLRAGSLQNSASTEFGTAPTNNTDTEWVSGELRPTGANTIGTRTATIDLGQAVLSPVIRLNAILDFLNHIPQFNNALVNPNMLTLEIDWAGRNGTYFGSFKPFRWNMKMTKDGTNKYNGEVGYSPASETPLEVRYLKIRVSIRTDYVSA